MLKYEIIFTNIIGLAKVRARRKRPRVAPKRPSPTRWLLAERRTKTQRLFVSPSTSTSTKWIYNEGRTCCFHLRFFALSTTPSVSLSWWRISKATRHSSVPLQELFRVWIQAIRRKKVGFTLLYIADSDKYTLLGPACEQCLRNCCWLPIVLLVLEQHHRTFLS